MTELPNLLFPQKGCYGLRDYEKAFCAVAETAQNIYDLRGIDRTRGCLLVVRPDQYIAQVLPISETHALAAFFVTFMLDHKP